MFGEVVDQNHANSVSLWLREICYTFSEVYFFPFAKKHIRNWNLTPIVTRTLMKTNKKIKSS